MRTTALIAWGLAVGFGVSCSPKATLPEAPATPAAPEPAPAASTRPATHANLNAVLFVQTAAEYAALARQAYTSAQLSLDEALDDPTWSAAAEQTDGRPFAGLPPAVVLDVDETVLDNSAYQARLIRDGRDYERATWRAWTAERAAGAVPGALAYAREAAARGITVVYVTNRRADEEDDTRANLAALGFPLTGEADVVLTRGERADWAASDKTTRREHLALRYRILQLVGDNLGDFIEVPTGTVADRRAAVDAYADYWGTRWIVLPNPTYGSWQSALSASGGEGLRY